MFVTNQKSGVYKSYKSGIKGVGVLDPGPIDNRNLLDVSGRIREHLNECQDYAVLQEPLWEFLWKHYGGGPVIKRTSFDIYSEPIDSKEEEEMYKKVAILNLPALENPRCDGNTNKENNKVRDFQKEK